MARYHDLHISADTYQPTMKLGDQIAITEFFPAELMHHSGGVFGALRVHGSDLIEAFIDAKACRCPNASSRQ